MCQILKGFHLWYFKNMTVIFCTHSIKRWSLFCPLSLARPSELLWPPNLAEMTLGEFQNKASRGLQILRGRSWSSETTLLWRSHGEKTHTPPSLQPPFLPQWSQLNASAWGSPGETTWSRPVNPHIVRNNVSFVLSH